MGTAPAAAQTRRRRKSKTAKDAGAAPAVLPKATIQHPLFRHARPKPAGRARAGACRAHGARDGRGAAALQGRRQRRLSSRIVRAAAAIIYDPETNEVLWEENAQSQRSIASITKVMTATVFLENNPT